jgi:hypothetical protein
MFLGLPQSDAVRGASSACAQAVHISTARKQTSEATKKCADCGSPNLDYFRAS